MKNKLLLITLGLIFPLNALAYFDVGTGSYLFQVLLASLLGGIYTLRAQIRVILSKLCFWKTPSPSKDPIDDTNDEHKKEQE